MPLHRREDVQQICALALQQGFAEPYQLAEAFRHFLQTKLAAGTSSYELELESGRIRLRDTGDSGEWGALDLPAPRYQGQWLPFAANKIALFSPALSYSGVFDRPTAELTPTPQGAMIRYQKQAYRLDTLLNTLIPTTGVERGPYDLVIPPGQNEGVFVVDRAAGQVLMADVTLAELRLRVAVRPPGSSKGLGLAYAPRYRFVFASDYTTSSLHLLNPESREYEAVDLQMGPLGALAVDETRNQIWILRAGEGSPVSLLCFDLESLALKQEVALPGQRFSDLDDPVDVMALAPDGKTLLVMTYVDQPALMTPLITAVDVSSGRVGKTTTLQREDKPVGLAFACTVAAGTDPDFLPFLQEAGLSEPQLKILQQLLTRLREDEQKPLMDAKTQALVQQLEAQFNAQELATVSEISQQALAQMAGDTFFQWEGREGMTPEDKRVLVERMAQIQVDKQMSRAHGVFVLQWLKTLVQ
jgi:hypothetical protein